MEFSEIYTTYPQHHEELDELAGKYEYDAEYTRAEAEDLVAKEMHKRHLLFVKTNLFYTGA